MGSTTQSVKVGSYEYRPAILEGNRNGLIRRDLNSGKEEKIFQSIFCVSQESDPVKKILAGKSGIYVLFEGGGWRVGKVVDKWSEVDKATGKPFKLPPMIEYVEVASVPGICSVKGDHFYAGDLIVKGGEVFAKGLCGSDSRGKGPVSFSSGCSSGCSAPHAVSISLKDIAPHRSNERCLGIGIHW